MASVIDNFFLAWGAPDDRRDAIVLEAVAEDVTYADPRGSVEGARALAAYVAQYSANAPGSAAEVVESTDAQDGTVVRVRFHGDWGEQFGRYRVRLDDDGRIAALDGVAERAE